MRRPYTISSCLGCADRMVGCHGTCKKYLEAKKEHDELMGLCRAKIRKEKDVYELFLEGVNNPKKKNGRWY